MADESKIELDDIVTEVLEGIEANDTGVPEKSVTIGHSVSPEIQDDVVDDYVEWLVNELDIPSETAQMAQSIYQQYRAERGDLEGTVLEVIASASLYCACKATEEPLDPDDFATVDGILSRRILLRRSKDIASKIGLDPSIFVSTEQYVERYCEELGLASETGERALNIIRELEKTGLSSGKSPSGWAAAAVYNASRDTGRVVTQKDIADIANVTTVTIRNRYQEQRMALRDIEDLPSDPSEIVEEIGDLANVSGHVQVKALNLIEAAKEEGIPVDDDPLIWTLAALRRAGIVEDEPIGLRVLNQFNDKESDDLKKKTMTLRNEVHQFKWDRE